MSSFSWHGFGDVYLLAVVEGRLGDFVRDCCRAFVDVEVLDEKPLESIASALDGGAEGCFIGETLGFCALVGGVLFLDELGLDERGVVALEFEGVADGGSV